VAPFVSWKIRQTLGTRILFPDILLSQFINALSQI